VRNNRDIRLGFLLRGRNLLHDESHDTSKHGTALEYVKMLSPEFAVILLISFGMVLILLIHSPVRGL